ncbi:WXG100 family type VII secretion target [Dactylosporangium sp. CA-092794]|uniref:WXG100 family type VII secretion target n=1 Tax=Dactylosporangium sp. CA-092794 TaxID=3239929 RepID=UPI003D94662A
MAGSGDPGLVRTDIDTMNHVVQQFGAEYDQLNSSMTKLRGTVDSTMPGFLGMGPDAFTQVHTELDAAWKQVNDALANIAHHINKSAVGYVNTDQQVQSNLRKVQPGPITQGLTLYNG